MTARRGSLAGVVQRVRHDVPSLEWESRLRVGIGSMHPSVRRVRAPPSIESSAPSIRTFTVAAGCALPDTGAGPQVGLHCWTVKVSVTGVMLHDPSNDGVSAHAREGRANRPTRTTSAARVAAA